MEWSVKASQYAEFIGEHYVHFAEIFKNFELAREYYKKAAELGDPWGMVQHTRSLKFENNEYCEWKKKALETNDPYAKWYFTDTISAEETKQLLIASAKTGNTSAMFFIRKHWEEECSEIDREECFNYLLESASRGHIRAQYAMGDYSHWENETTKAYRWFKKSAGYDLSKRKLEQLEYTHCELKKENTRDAIFTLICIKKYRQKILCKIPIDIIFLIVHLLWDSRGENVWDFSVIKTIKKQKM
jgi:hypothetical protein